MFVDARLKRSRTFRGMRLCNKYISYKLVHVPRYLAMEIIFPNPFLQGILDNQLFEAWKSARFFSLALSICRNKSFTGR